MTQISAKFKVRRVTPQNPIRGRSEGEMVDQSEVEMIPDYAGDRNKEWSYYTPCGVIRMTVNGPALEQLTEGRAFTILMTPEDEE